MAFDADKVDDVVLALLQLVLHRNRKHGPWRAWKGFDWDTLDRLHEKGYISDPASKAKSVVVTEEGLERSEALFEEFFGVGEDLPSSPDELVAHDTFLDAELLVDGELESIALDTRGGLGPKEFLSGQGPDGDAWLDTETGRTVWFSNLEPPRVDADPGDLADWERDQVEEYWAVQNDTEGRFLCLEAPLTHESWRDMADFTSLVQHDQLRAELADAIEGRGAFSRFRRVIDSHEPLRQAWFGFRDARADKRVHDWLATKGYRLVEDGEGEDG